MSGIFKYYVTGWSARFGMWVGEVIEAASMTQATTRFKALNPTLKRTKAYLMRTPAEVTE